MNAMGREEGEVRHDVLLSDRHQPIGFAGITFLA